MQISNLTHMELYMLLVYLKKKTVWEGRLGQEGAMSGHSKWRKIE